MLQDSRPQWIKEVLVPRILNNERFRGAVISESDVRAMDTMKDNFASDMFEINLAVIHHGKEISLSFLSKLMFEDENLRVLNQSDKQFFNEIHLYSTVLPLISSHIPSQQIKSDFENLFPKCYYSFYNNKKPDSFEDAVVVLENLKLRDFKLGDRTSLDLKHCTLALKRLGIFHAVSYFLKAQYPDTFKKVVVKPIKESSYVPSKREIIDNIFRHSEHRVIDALAAEVSEDDSGLTKLRQLASRDVYDLFIELIHPKEPLAVLSHGDFLRNNMLFRYENGEPVDMKFIDFQMARYASPAIDLSVFICMCTSHELRVSHFDRLLHVYHSSLTDTLIHLFGKPEEQLDPCYSFKYFLDDFRKHAVYGYFIAVEFLPTMLASKEDLEEHVKLSGELGSPKFLEAARSLGGDRVTRVVVDLAKDLLNKNCL